MPANRRTPWLICYDIADPRRLQRVHRVARRHAIPLQYSVFHTIATRHEVLGMLHDIEEHIDPRQDDVRAYPLLTAARPVVVGGDFLASGITLCRSAAPGLTGVEHPPAGSQLDRASRDGSTHFPTPCSSTKKGDMPFRPQT